MVSTSEFDEFTKVLEIVIHTVLGKTGLTIIFGKPVVPAMPGQINSKL